MQASFLAGGISRMILNLFTIFKVMNWNEIQDEWSRCVPDIGVLAIRREETTSKQAS